VAGAVGDEALGQVEGPVRVPDILGEDQHRVRGPKVQQLGAARPHLAEADLALTGTESPARRFVEGREQGGAAVVVDFQWRGGTAGKTDRLGGDVFLQVGDGFAVADEDGLPEPDLAAGFDATPGATNSDAGCRSTWMRLIWICWPGAAEDLLEGADAFDADAGEGVGDEPADAAAGPDEAVLLEQHEGLADHGAADLHVGPEFGLGGEHGAGLQQIVADGFGDP
jgi:hypothetical protein